MTFLSATPTRNAVVSLEPEELGAVLLMRVRAAQANEEFDGSRNRMPPTLNRPLPTGIRLTDILPTYENLEVGLREPFNPPSDVTRALYEAWAWLHSAGLILAHPDGSGRCILTKRGSKLATEQDVADHRERGILPIGLLHPSIMSTVYDLFVRRLYELAVFHAFKRVEIAMREAVDAPAHLTGEKVARMAFDQNTGLLRDQSKVDSERQAEANMISGIIGCLKNPSSHREVETERSEATRLVMFASHLLFLVDSRKAAYESSPS